MGIGVTNKFCKNGDRIMNQKVDVAIVGAGTAGLAALREVRQWTDDLIRAEAMAGFE